MSNLYNDIQDKISLLDVMIDKLRTNGQHFAETERDYKILLRQECLKLKDGGMAIGLIDKTCYGIPSVATARFNRDVAEVYYKANLEAINALKLQMRIMEEQLAREWGNVK